MLFGSYEATRLALLLAFAAAVFEDAWVYVASNICPVLVKTHSSPPGQSGSPLQDVPVTEQTLATGLGVHVVGAEAAAIPIRFTDLSTQV